MQIHFFKYQATGNDFILLDNRKSEFDFLNQKQIEWLCDRRIGIGADGLMLLNEKNGYDFEMKYFNADGAPGSMCGNGGRCIVAFANKRGIKKGTYTFLAYDGDHEAKMQDDGGVALKMNSVKGIETDGEHKILNTGSPHLILNVEDADAVDVYYEGKKIRNSAKYAEEGINVNFVQRLNEDSIFVRTYERGVEDETYSCGTGVTASALASAAGREGHYDFRIRTKGGMLGVSFDYNMEGFESIWLSGPAEFVFEGNLQLNVQ